MIADLRSFWLRFSIWASTGLLLVSCLLLSSCVYIPEAPVDPDLLNLLDRLLLALRDKDAETVVSSTIYYDYQARQYREGTQEDVKDLRILLNWNPELWNFQSYTITRTQGGNFLLERRYQIDVKVQFEDGTTRVFAFYFVYHNGKWWHESSRTLR